MPRVLVALANPELAAHLAEVIDLAGLEALVADDPRALLGDSVPAAFDAALLDARLPGTDATELLRALARRSPDALYLWMTTSDDPPVAGRVVARQAILAKPFGPDVLVAALRDAGLGRAGRA